MTTAVGKALQDTAPAQKPPAQGASASPAAGARDISIRRAQAGDLKALVALENRCFAVDRLSRRSFLNFVREGPHQLLVALQGEQLAGYSLILYRTGTSLARIYSIATSPEFQGRGIAVQLVKASERAARQQHCVFMRLEVRVDNDAAINLYRKLGYKDFDSIADYYEDGCDARRMEKRIHRGESESVSYPHYYQQTTDFTCGPACLMMAMRAQCPDYAMSRHEELQIWREATTIFMTSGHGGCSPHGLALSAWRRGFSACLYINQATTPFIDSVRSAEKKTVLELVHQDFMEQIANSSIELFIATPAKARLQEAIAEGYSVVALISTWGLSRNKAPHWVYIADADDQFVYIHDPDNGDNPWQNETDYIRVPIGWEPFERMASFGRSRLKSFLLIKAGAGSQ